MYDSLVELVHRWVPLSAEKPWLLGLALLVVAIVIAKLVDWLITGLLAAWARRTRTKLDDRLLELLHRPLFFSVLLVGVWLAVTRLDLNDAIMVLILRSLKTAGLFLWTVFAVRASMVVLEGLSHLESRVSFIEPRTLALAKNTAKVVLIGAALYLFFLAWGIDLGAWIVSAGALGLILGLAAKDSLANLFAGMFILADAPYEVGDFVNLDSGERGRVTHIGLRSTRLLTRDDVEVTVPNSVIANSKIINESGGPWEKERVRVKVGVAYGSDLDRVRQTLMSVAAENELLAADPKPRVRIRGFADSAVEFELLGWIDEPVLRGRALDSLYDRVYKEFSARKIKIPFPQRVVHLQSPGGGEVPPRN